jgi:hypothetical protein
MANELFFLNLKRLVQTLVINLVKIMKLVGRLDDVEYISTTRCEPFLIAFREKSNTEMSLDDCIETIKNSKTVEASKNFMSVECELCFSTLNMNKVNFCYTIADSLYFVIF